MKIDGKEVRKFLFARLSRIKMQGCIPTDDRRRFIVQAQVEGFTLDHAWERLTKEIFPNVRRADWQLLEELDASHDIGKLGSSHPIQPKGSIVLPAHLRVQ